MIAGIVGRTTPGIYARQPCGCSAYIIAWANSSPYSLFFFGSPDESGECRAGLTHTLDEALELFRNSFNK